MRQALYRKYRSKSFDDVVGQEHITKTLKNALNSGKISHAYLFTGPRGVGKTSVARILAHEVNDLPYTDESVHLDIIEIDAASNRRIDEIRDLREKVNIAPSAARFKVYIIDEVHMLTREAFNALLKTLEEPPAHCVFILATTEAHKLPDTIVSRTQRFEFKTMNTRQAAEHLGSIAKREKIDIEPEALELLAQFGDGSFRDSISFLDQLSAYSKKITASDVRGMLGLPTNKEIYEVLQKLSKPDMPAVLAKLNNLESQGIKASAIAASLSEMIREQAKTGINTPWQIELLKDLMNVPASARPQESLEVAVLSSMSKRTSPSDSSSKIKSSNGVAEKMISRLSIDSDEISQPAGDPDSSSDITAEFDLSLWNEIVDKCKKQAASIYTALRLAKPDYDAGVLTLNFQFPLHQKKLELAKNKHLVSQIIYEVCGQKIAIKTALNQDNTAKSKEIITPLAAVNISNIFGAAEVIET